MAMARRVEIYDVQTGRGLGEIGETDLRRLIDLFEEESEQDRDYWIDEPTLDMLQEQGLDPGLLARLRTGLAGRDGFDLGWREVA
jgi:hypothetical protein